jgi:hypothetical protein
MVVSYLLSKVGIPMEVKDVLTLMINVGAFIVALFTLVVAIVVKCSLISPKIGNLDLSITSSYRILKAADRSVPYWARSAPTRLMIR